MRLQTLRAGCFLRRYLARFSARQIDPRGAFDVNPVVWAELAHGGVTVRGPGVAEWGLAPEPDLLAGWTRDNLRDYWSPLADRVARGSRPLRERG